MSKPGVANPHYWFRNRSSKRPTCKVAIKHEHTMTGPEAQKRLRDSNAILESTSFLSGANADFIEELYARFLENPDAVEASWRSFFAELGEQRASAQARGAQHRPHLRPRLAREDADLIGALTGYWPPDQRGASTADARAAARESIRAIQLVRAYRVIGHLAADLDPLKLARKPQLPQLDPNYYGFHESDVDRPVIINGVLGLETATPRQMVE